MAAKFIGEAFISGAIQLLLERFASPEVVNFLLGKRDSDFEDLLKRLKIMVNSLTAVLDDAEQRQMRNDPRVEAWLDELQQAVFDADDLLDEIETDALRLKVKGEFSAGTSEVRETKRPKLFNMFSSWSRSSNDRDILENKINKLLYRLTEIAKQKDLLGLKENFAEEKRGRRLPSTSLVDESEVFGRDEEKEALIESVLSDFDEVGSKFGVIPIVGMGGIGKTTLAQAVFNNEKVQRHFELKAWVCISEDFDVVSVMKTLLRSVSLSSSQDCNDLNSLQVKLKEELTGKKFLIVLDDVWNEKYDDWEVMKMPFKDGAKGSKIIVTTRSKEVARITGTGSTIPVHELGVLTEEASWQLFAKHAFGDSTTNPDLERIGRKIVEKCKGLPLAVKTLGGLLCFKFDIDDWEGILASEIWELTDEQSGILPALRLSYHYLPSHLKRCFAYCSIFPKDYKFNKEDLILLWMAESLLEQPKGNKRIEDVGDQYFNELLSRSFFQRSRSRFVMHDLIVDLANFVSSKYCFRLEGRNSDKIMMETRHLACVGNFDIIDEIFSSISKATRVRTFLPLNFRGPCRVSKEAVRDFFLKLKYLRVLSLYSFRCSELVGSICELRHLRFLDLSHSSIDRLPDSMSTLYNLQTLKLAYCRSLKKLPKDFHHLINLRYLDASFTRLEELPESLSLLYNLQKLILSRCLNLAKLPEGFHRLINLRYLNIEGSGLKEMPIQISKIKSLQTLSTFVVGKDSGAKISELGKLPNLRGTMCIENLQNVVKPEDALEAKLREKEYLEKLNLEWANKHEANDSIKEWGLLDNLMPNTSLKTVEIKWYGGTKFPDWIGHQSFCDIVYVFLSNCHHCMVLPPLGQLPSLKTLKIESFEAVVNVSGEFYGNSLKPFASLEVLEFYNMPNWEEWTMPDGDAEAFPKLRELTLQDCKNLTGNLPCFLPSLIKLTITQCQQLASSLPRMPKVTKVELNGCCESIMRSVEALESSSYLQNLKITGNLHSLRFRRLPVALKTLYISSCVASFELQLQPQSHDSLEELSIECNKGSFSLSFALDSFPNIRTLSLVGCENLESQWVSFESLKSLSTLSISNCPDLTYFPIKLLNLTSLTLRNFKELKFPEQMLNVLPSLEYLSIGFCTELELFPTSGLPSTLRTLQIVNCDKLVASRASWNLQRLPNLTSFWILGCKCEDMESFPEEGLLPSTITGLVIGGIECLKSLDNKGLQQLTSLKSLSFLDCRNLQKMPDEGLPASLESLQIIDCRMLEDKCKRETGEYWSKIAHIPWIFI